MKTAAQHDGMKPLRWVEVAALVSKAVLPAFTHLMEGNIFYKLKRAMQGRGVLRIPSEWGQWPGFAIF